MVVTGHQKRLGLSIFMLFVPALCSLTAVC